MENIVLVSFEDTIANYKLLYEWCSKRDVYEWFEQRILSYDEIVTKYKNKLKDKKQELYIIKYNNHEIGFVQIYKYNFDIKLDKLNKYKNIYEYDLFIGVEKYLSKGIGQKIVNNINKMIQNKYNPDCIILRPFKRNIRAIKCYQKCNFYKIDEYIGSDSLGNKEEIVVLINNLL